MNYTHRQTLSLVDQAQMLQNVSQKLNFEKLRAHCASISSNKFTKMLRNFSLHGIPEVRETWFLTYFDEMATF